MTTREKFGLGNIDPASRKELARYYARKQLLAEDKANKQRAYYRDRYPQLIELERAVVMENIAVVKNLTEQEVSSPEAEGDLNVHPDRSAVEQAMAALRSFKLEHGIPEAYDQVQHECNNCLDTGFVDGHYCSCVGRAMREIQLARAEFLPEAECNFSNFSAEIFSGETSPDYYQGKLSPRLASQSYKRLGQNYVAAFPHNQQPNLYLFGPTGTGKSFLLSAICNEILAMGYSVVYIRANRLFTIFQTRRQIKQSFSPQPEELDTNRQEWSRLYTCQLLAIDDLGTEAYNSQVFADFMELIETRTRQGQASLISSNLTPKEMGKRFSERLESRLVGNFALLPFAGPDIRLELARLQKEGGL